MRSLSALLVLSLALVGCDDGGGDSDAGPSGVDAGPGGVDAGSTGTDAGPTDTDAGATDAGPVETDAGPTGDDAGATDAGPTGTDAGAMDAGSDAGPTGTDAGMVVRTAILPGFCPSSPTAAGFYRGTLASNTNDIAGACTVSGPGRDGAVRVELAHGQTVRAVYRHAGDGVLYILDSCPVVGSCLDSSDSSISGAETVEYTNTGDTTNPVYVVLDSDSLSGPQTFELDLYVTP
ncbi:MAG: hypothetical protein H6719_30850 [Sandaracinaceae bacterium]|nr:hypothetical protein [Sandaracinaceae bacterium]